MSALAILAGQAPAETSETVGHIGVWNAKASGKATVQLSLNSDNSFEWVAAANGKTQRFAGTFELSNNKLTLSRSSDNQKMAGTITFSGSGFNFKLDGTKDAGLEFSRQG